MLFAEQLEVLPIFQTLLWIFATFLEIVILSSFSSYPQIVDQMPYYLCLGLDLWSFTWSFTQSFKPSLNISKFRLVLMAIHHPQISRLLDYLIQSQSLHQNANSYQLSLTIFLRSIRVIVVILLLYQDQLPLLLSLRHSLSSFSFSFLQLRWTLLRCFT